MLCNFAIKRHHNGKPLKDFRMQIIQYNLKICILERYKIHYDSNKYLIQNDVHNNFSFVVILIGYLVILEKNTLRVYRQQNI